MKRRKELSLALRNGSFWIGLATFITFMLLTGTIVARSKTQTICAEVKKPAVKKTAQVAPTLIPNSQVTVQANDSYFKISARVCGTGRYFMFIQEENNNMPLHPGEKVTVTCPQ